MSRWSYQSLFLSTTRRKTSNLCSSEIKTVLTGAKTYEIVLLTTGAKIGHLKTRGLQREPAIGVVRLKRNFGQTAALAAGSGHADGNVIVTMDGDAQNDPADIPALLAELEKGNDLVSRLALLPARSIYYSRLPSMIANRLISWATQVKLHDYGCT